MGPIDYNFVVVAYNGIGFVAAGILIYQIVSFLQDRRAKKIIAN